MDKFGRRFVIQTMLDNNGVMVLVWGEGDETRLQKRTGLDWLWLTTAQQAEPGTSDDESSRLSNPIPRSGSGRAKHKRKAKADNGQLASSNKGQKPGKKD